MNENLPVMFANKDCTVAMDAGYVSEARLRTDGLWPQFASTYVVPLYDKAIVDRLTVERDIANMAAENYRKLLAVANDLVAYKTQIIQRLQAQS